MPTQLEQTYLEIGRLYVQSIEFSEKVQGYLEILEFAEFSDVVDFAAASGKARKKPNCNPAKSQLCGNACVSLSKKCAKETAGAEKQAADFNTKAVAAKKEKPVKEVAPKTPKATKSKAKKVDEVIEPVAAKAVQAKPRAEDVTPPPKAETLAPVKPASEELSANLFGKTRKTTKSKAKKVEEVTESVAANAAQAKPKAEEITPTPTPKAEAPAPKKEEVPAPVKAKVEDVAPQPQPQAKTRAKRSAPTNKKAEADPGWQISGTKFVKRDPANSGIGPRTIVEGTRDGVKTSISFYSPRNDPTVGSRLGDAASYRNKQVLYGASPNPGNIHYLPPQSLSGDLKKVKDDADLFIASLKGLAKNGDTIAIQTENAAELGVLAKAYGKKAFTDTSLGYQYTLVGRYQDGEIVAIPAKELKSGMESYSEASRLRDLQFGKAVSRQIVEDLSKEDKAKLEAEEDDFAAKLAKVEDAWVGRKPTPGSIPSADEYKKKAEDWAKSQGFTDGGVNGFTAEATKAHDIAHPLTHDLVGLNSAQINQTLGSLKGVSGKPSLVAEEAVVNIVEHLSRGDSLSASILNGVRLARVQSRDPKFETDETRAYVRSKEFKNALSDLADKIYKNDNFSEYMKIVREFNRVSGTVTASGEDFTNSASGG